MKHLLLAASALSLLAGSFGAAAAQPGRDDHRMDDHGAMNGGPAMAHNNWRKGGRIASTDWRRGQVVDYRSHHLRAPPRGYQWRQVDGNYVLAAVAGGLIADIIAGN